MNSPGCSCAGSIVYGIEIETEDERDILERLFDQENNYTDPATGLIFERLFSTDALDIGFGVEVADTGLDQLIVLSLEDIQARIAEIDAGVKSFLIEHELDCEPKLILWAYCA
jgi:hypothetical protein